MSSERALVTGVLIGLAYLLCSASLGWNGLLFTFALVFTSINGAMYLTLRDRRRR